MTAIYEGTLRESGNAGAVNKLLAGMGLGGGAGSSVAALTAPQSGGRSNSPFAMGGVKGLGSGAGSVAGGRGPTASGRRGPTWGVWDGGWEDLVTAAVLVGTFLVLFPKVKKLVGI